MRSSCLINTEFQFCKMKRVLSLVPKNGKCERTLLKYTIKNGKDGKFHILYFSTSKKNYNEFFFVTYHIGKNKKSLTIHETGKNMRKQSLILPVGICTGAASVESCWAISIQLNYPSNLLVCMEIMCAQGSALYHCCNSKDWKPYKYSKFIHKD